MSEWTGVQSSSIVSSKGAATQVTWVLPGLVRARRSICRWLKPMSLSKMADETRNYVPKLQAVKNIVANPQKYGLVLADVPNAPYFTVVRTTVRMDVKRAGRAVLQSPVSSADAANARSGKITVFFGKPPSRSVFSPFPVSTRIG